MCLHVSTHVLNLCLVLLLNSVIKGRTNICRQREKMRWRSETYVWFARRQTDRSRETVTPKKRVQNAVTERSEDVCLFGVRWRDVCCCKMMLLSWVPLISIRRKKDCDAYFFLSFFVPHELFFLHILAAFCWMILARSVGSILRSDPWFTFEHSRETTHKNSDWSLSLP